MIALNRNKQKMYYSIPSGTEPIYETDDDGNIITFTDDDGNEYNMETGENYTSYGEAVEFSANITGHIKSVIMRSFGADNSDNYAILWCSKGMLPFTIGTVIWRNSEVTYNDDGTPDASNADYVIRGILDEQLNEDMYLLTKLKVDTGEV